MRWQCVQDFGLHRRGDFVVLPDDAEASPQYFIQAPEEEEQPVTVPEPTEQLLEEAPPTASDEATGATEPTNDQKKGKG